MALAELRYEFIRTPLEEPLLRLRHAVGWFGRRRHPELREIHREDRRIVEVLRRVLTTGTSCLDVGAHYGSMLSRLCRAAPGGRHVAFEVIPAKVSFLRRKFPEVDVRQLALADRTGRTRFFVCAGRSGFSSLARPTRRASSAIDAEAARLDDVVPSDRAFGFVKLDVEGAELLVIRGAARTLARDRPVLLFECGPSGPPSFGYRPEDLHDHLCGPAGYSVFTLAGFLGQEGPVGRQAFAHACTVYPFTAFNWVAVPAERRGAP
jgi:FkbM family methyltransferase